MALADSEASCNLRQKSPSAETQDYPFRTSEGLGPAKRRNIGHSRRWNLRRLRQATPESEYGVRQPRRRELHHLRLHQPLKVHVCQLDQLVVRAGIEGN